MKDKLSTQSQELCPDAPTCVSPLMSDLVDGEIILLRQPLTTILFNLPIEFTYPCTILLCILPGEFHSCRCSIIPRGQKPFGDWEQTKSQHTAGGDWALLLDFEIITFDSP